MQENYSRIPVYENDIDNIIGVIYMKDIFSEIIKKESKMLILKVLLENHM